MKDRYFFAWFILLFIFAFAFGYGTYQLAFGQEAEPLISTSTEGETITPDGEPLPEPKKPFLMFYELTPKVGYETEKGRIEELEKALSQYAKDLDTCRYRTSIVPTVSSLRSIRN